MKNYISIIFIIALSSITSLINQICIAHFFGANAELDILNISMALPNSMMALSVGGLNLVLIPILTATKLDGKNVRHIIVFFENKMLIWGISSIVVLFFIQILFYKNRIPTEIFYKFIIISIFSSCFLFLTLLNSIYLSWANIEKKYVLTSFGGIFLNLTSIITCYFFHSYLGIYVLPITLILSSFILNYFLKYSLTKRNSPQTDYWDFKFPKLGLSIGASILSVIPFAFPSFVDSYLLSDSLVGNVSYTAYANKLVTVLGLLIIQPLNLILFPVFSEMINKKDIISLSKIIENTIFFIIFICLFVVIFVNKFFLDVINIIFNHGLFKAKDAENLTELMKYYVLGLAGMALMNILNRLFAALSENIFQIIISISFIIVYFLIAQFFYATNGYLSVGISYFYTWTFFVMIAIIKFYTYFKHSINYVGYFLFLICVFANYYFSTNNVILILNCCLILSTSLFFLKNIIKTQNEQ